MADALSLLFELDADGRPAVAEFQRIRRAFAGEIAALRKTVAQSFTLPPIKLPTATTAGGRGQVDAHVKEFRRLEAEAAKSSKAQESEQTRLNRAVQSLQRQRSAAIIAGWKAEERAAIASMRAQERAAQQASRAIANAFRSIGPGLQSIGRTLTIGITAPLLALGAASLKSAKDLDANVNTLKAFTGSAEAAERRLAELIKASRGTPGLTTNLALTLDAQLRTAQVMEETINRVLPAIGRLNAVSKLPDAGRFTQNLLQLVTQDFERQDLKELVGQSPIAGQLIREIFNVDSPTNAKAIRESAKKLGINSVDSFFAAFAEAAQRNQGLATVTESIGTRFDKIVDRVTVALRPLGLAIIKAIEPFIEPISKLIERLGDAFNSLSPPVKTAIIVIAGIAAAAGPVLFVLGGLVTGITAVVSAIGTIAAAVAAVGLPAIAAAVGGITILVAEWAAILAVLGLAWKKNFLNIRGLVSAAASAVLQAFNRIKVVFDEATRRILPTLQSITAKVIGAITALWEKYGDDIVAFVGAAFRFITDVTVRFLKTFADVVDLVLKLIDGDWRGAWNAFSRITIRALELLENALVRLPAILVRAFLQLNQIILAQAVRFAVAAQQLAVKFVASLAIKLIQSAPTIRDALIDMLALAVAGVNPTTIAAVLIGRLLAAMRKAASEAPPIPIKVEAQNVGADVGFTGGIARPKKKDTTTDDKESDKGADAAARRRIRILELEAEKVRTLTDAQLAREQIAFDERQKSLEDYTNAQIKAAGDVLLAQLKIYKQERDEANKIRNQSVRDLALAEIGQKEFEAQQAFDVKVKQLEVGRRKEEFEAAKAHRQALLDLQEQGDAAELARLEDLQRQGKATAFDVANRQAEIEKAARERRKKELEEQLTEAGANVEEQKRVSDELDKINAESAESVRRNERLKREALRETVEAYNSYKRAIIEAQEEAAALIREASIIQLESLRRRLGDRRRILREEFKIEQEAAEARHRENLRQIDDREQAAISGAEKAGDIEQRRLEIEREFHDLRLAEDDRFNAEHQANQEEFERALDPLGPLKDRWDQFREAVQNANDSIADSVQSVAARIAESFDAMVDATRQGIAAWILYGESLGAALKKALAVQLANLAAEFAIQAIRHAAFALGSLAFGDLGGAARHAAAAAAFTAAAAATGFAGRALAKSSGLFKGNQSSTAASAVNGGEDREPRNRTFNGPGSVETSLQSAVDGSAGPRGFFGHVVEVVNQVRQDIAARDALLIGALNNNTQAVSRLRTQPKGVVVADGLDENPAAAGRAILVHSGENNDFTAELLRRMNFA